MASVFRERRSPSAPAPSTTAPILASYVAAAVLRDVLPRDIPLRRDFAPFASCSTRRFRLRPTAAGRVDDEEARELLERSFVVLFFPSRSFCRTRNSRANTDNAV